MGEGGIGEDESPYFDEASANAGHGEDEYHCEDEYHYEDEYGAYDGLQEDSTLRASAYQASTSDLNGYDSLDLPLNESDYDNRRGEDMFYDDTDGSGRYYADDPDFARPNEGNAHWFEADSSLQGGDSQYTAGGVTAEDYEEDDYEEDFAADDEDPIGEAPIVNTGSQNNKGILSSELIDAYEEEFDVDDDELGGAASKRMDLASDTSGPQFDYEDDFDDDEQVAAAPGAGSGSLGPPAASKSLGYDEYEDEYANDFVVDSEHEEQHASQKAAAGAAAGASKKAAEAAGDDDYDVYDEDFSADLEEGSSYKSSSGEYGDGYDEDFQSDAGDAGGQAAARREPGPIFSSDELGVGPMDLHDDDSGSLTEAPLPQRSPPPSTQHQHGFDDSFPNQESKSLEDDDDDYYHDGRYQDDSLAGTIEAGYSNDGSERGYDEGGRRPPARGMLSSDEESFDMGDVVRPGQDYDFSDDNGEFGGPLRSPSRGVRQDDFQDDSLESLN